MDDEDKLNGGTQPVGASSGQPLKDGSVPGRVAGFASGDPATSDKTAKTKETNRSAGDSLVNALVMVGLVVAAVALWEVAAVAAVAVAVVAVTVAVLESQEEIGNIFDHKGNMITAVGLGVATLLLGTGNVSLGLAAVGLAAVPQLDRIFNFLVGFNLSETTWWIILLIIAIFVYALKNGKFNKWMAPRHGNKETKQ